MSRKGPIEIGAPMPRVDACPKVRGETKFAADFYDPGVLWAGVKRAGIPHARIKNIDVEEARNCPGVVCVLTHRDIRGSNRQGVIRKDQPVLAEDKVRHCGDGVALIVAESREAMNQAKERVSVALDLLPGVFTPADAFQEGAPLVHEDNPRGNVLLRGRFETGRVDSAWNESDIVVEATFELPCQEHAYLETESGWAILKDSGILEITASTQTPFRDRVEVAEAIGLEMEKIRIIAPYCGGAFGGKDGITVQSLLALAALHCPGRPVKMWWDREESFLASVKRHPAILCYRLGAKADGTLHALDGKIYYDTGPYDLLGGAVLTLGLEHAGGPYRIPHVRMEGWSVYTNNPVGGAFRGFGVPQVTAAMEQMVDRVASRSGLSSLEVRLRNGVREGDVNPVGIKLKTSTGLIDCLKTIDVHPLWQERQRWKSSARPFKRRGVGIACVMHGMGYGPVIPDQAAAKIELTEEGRFRIFSGVVDMGQGNGSTYLQIAGHILNQETDRLEIILPDTAKTLPSGSSSASRTTFTFGNALIRASQAFRERLLRQGKDFFKTDLEEEVELHSGRLFHVPTGRTLALDQLVLMLPPSERGMVSSYRSPVVEGADAHIKDENLRLHGFPHLIFSYGAHLACVEVDELTGQVEIIKYLAVSDCGRVINPQVFEQQIHGGVSQGLGYALCEELRTKGGRIETPDFSTYILPTSADTPDIESIAVEEPEENGPFGLKGAGEISIDGPLPAVANGISDACGIRIHRFPLTAERVLGALKRGAGEGGWV